eukprot:4353797-Ditylum_brightwellii.AAC.1
MMQKTEERSMLPKLLTTKETSLYTVRVTILTLYKLIIYEAETDWSLSTSAASVWSFLCTYPETEDGTYELYAQTVQGIISSLDYECVCMLASFKVKRGSGEEPVAIRNCANPKCVAL